MQFRLPMFSNPVLHILNFPKEQQPTTLPLSSVIYAVQNICNRPDLRKLALTLEPQPSIELCDFLQEVTSLSESGGIIFKTEITNKAS
jgi:hypothetical protein